MLCKINSSVGGVATDQKSRYYNVMCSLHEIATATAGSTPTVNPVDSGGTRDTNFNCITVLSNSEGAGWTTGFSNHYTASSTFTSSVTYQYLDLWRTSGKSSAPYYRISMTQGTSGAFNSSFTTYPGVRYCCGSTVVDPSTSPVNGDSNFWISSNASTRTAATDQTAYNYPDLMMRFDEVEEFTVAVTPNYFIIVGAEHIWYFGLRTQAGWELSRTDNPPWVHFGYSRRNNDTQVGYRTDYFHSEIVAAYGAIIYKDGSQLDPRVNGQHTYRSNNYACALTGAYGLGVVNPNPGIAIGNNINVPIMPGATLNSNYANSTVKYDGIVTHSPVIDTTTGLNVPPAFPIVINARTQADYGSALAGAFIGTVPGIYKAMCGPADYVDQFITASSYTINGDTYVPVKSGNLTYYDYWFVRSA